MSLSNIKAILNSKRNTGPLITEIEVPQLEFFNPALRSAGVPPIRFGDLFRTSQGREPEPGEYVRFNFTQRPSANGLVPYRGAIGWHSKTSVQHNGATYAVVPRPKANFLLGEGWVTGQTPGQIELNIAATCSIWTASGIPWKPENEYDLQRTDCMPGAVFSFEGTEAFVNPTTPLIFNHHGNIWLAGGTGAGGASRNYANSVESRAGGCGKGWPHCPYPHDYINNLGTSIDIIQDTILGGSSLPGPGVDGEFFMVLHYWPNASTSSNANQYHDWNTGDGGSYGQMGRGSFVSMYEANYPSSEDGELTGTSPAALFHLGSNSGTRFVNWAGLTACVDMSGSTGKVNSFGPSFWNTAPVWNGGNPSWSWRHGIYRDVPGIGGNLLFGSTYFPLGNNYWFKPIIFGEASPYAY